MIAIPHSASPPGPTETADSAAISTVGAGGRLLELPPEVVLALHAAGTRRQWRLGQTVLRQGERTGAVVVALQGRLAVMLGRATGTDALMRWMEEGEITGLPDVLAQLPSPVSIVTHGAAMTLHVERKAFLDVLHQHPAGAIGIAVQLARRVGELFRYVETSGSRTLAERLNFALLRLAGSQGQADGAGGICLTLTQAELAAAAGASRQRVHLALRQMQADGRLTLGYGTVTLLPRGGWTW